MSIIPTLVLPCLDTSRAPPAASVLHHIPHLLVSPCLSTPHSTSPFPQSILLHHPLSLPVLPHSFSLSCYSFLNFSLQVSLSSSYFGLSLSVFLSLSYHLYSLILYLSCLSLALSLFLSLSLCLSLSPPPSLPPSLYVSLPLSLSPSLCLSLIPYPSSSVSFLFSLSLIPILSLPVSFPSHPLSPCLPSLPLIVSPRQFSCAACLCL